MLIENNKFFKPFDASEYKVGIVVAQFNQGINDQMLKSALEVAKNYNINLVQIDIRKVAGSIEIPLMLQKLAQTKKYDCLVAIGSIIKGETSHFDYVAKIVSEGILRVMLDNNIPIGFGILTTNNLEQAQERISSGAAALEAALWSVVEGKLDK